MKNKFLYTRKEMRKPKVVSQELKRAHFVIALLSSSLAFIVAICSMYPVELNVGLASVAVVLLIIVCAMSLSVSSMIKIKK